MPLPEGGRHVACACGTRVASHTEEAAVCLSKVGEGGAHDGRQNGGVSAVPRAHYRHIRVGSVTKRLSVRAQNVEDGAALLRVFFF